MKRNPSTRPSLSADRRGVVFLEFLIAFVPLWVFFLCLIQLAFVSYADLVVKHSADSAARSAAVVLPDDPSEYGDEPERSLDPNRVTRSDLEAALSRVGSVLGRSADAVPIASPSSGEALLNLGRSRLNTVRLAAHVPLLPLASLGFRYGSTSSIAAALATERGLVSALLYQPLLVALTFPGADAGIVEGPEITVRVTYAYPCVVPVARRILCDSFGELGSQHGLGRAPVPIAQRILRGRFRLIRRESTLMIHDAPYTYQIEGSGRS